MGIGQLLLVALIAGVLLTPIVRLILRYNRYVRRDGVVGGRWRSPQGEEYNVESDI